MTACWGTSAGQPILHTAPRCSIPRKTQALAAGTTAFPVFQQEMRLFRKRQSLGRSVQVLLSCRKFDPSPFHHAGFRHGADRLRLDNVSSMAGRASNGNEECFQCLGNFWFSHQILFAGRRQAARRINLHIRKVPFPDTGQSCLPVQAGAPSGHRRRTVVNLVLGNRCLAGHTTRLPESKN
ncbi:MAG: hypothetical protein RLY31_3067 [Bacteroidota bacterium]